MDADTPDACEGVCFPCRQTCMRDCAVHCGLQFDVNVADDDVPF